MEDVITVGELLDGYLVSGVQTKSSGSFIADLQNQYPNMQISVPVHAEDWDVENYIPTVVFVPEEFSEKPGKNITKNDYRGNYCNGNKNSFKVLSGFNGIYYVFGTNYTYKLRRNMRKNAPYKFTDYKHRRNAEKELYEKEDI